MSQKIKILYLCSTLDSKTGSGRFNSGLIKALENNFGLENVVVTEKEGGGNFEILSDNRKNPIRLFRALLAIKKLSKACDLVHALDGWPYGFYGALLGKPLVITALGTYSVAPLHKFPHQYALKYAYNKSSVIVGISKYTSGQIIKELPLLKNKIKTINPGIDLRQFNETGSKQNHKESFILSVGALKRRKGYHISIPAFALARKKIPNLKYVIVGNARDKKCFNHLKQVAEDHDVLNTVDFISNVNDTELADLYRRAKLFILTSVNEGYKFEGFGLVFLEAAASGLSIIGSENNGIEDAVWNGYNGILVPQNRIEETADVIVKILSDPSLSEKMSSAGLDWAKNHSWEKVARQYVEIYEQLNK